MDKLIYLAAEFDNDTQSVLKEYEKIITENGFIGKQTKDIPYHITLCSYTPDKENELTMLMQKIETENIFNAFNLSLSSFGLFGLNVLFLNPEMNIKLIEIYDYVKDLSLHKDSDLAAHVTLFIDEPENVLSILPKMVKMTNGKIIGKIKYLSLTEYFPKRHIKRIELSV